MERFGPWLKSLRLSLGWTQGDLAERLGFKSPQAIANIERGSAPFPQTRIKRLYQALELPPDAVVARLVSDYELRLRERLGLYRHESP